MGGYCEDWPCLDEAPAKGAPGESTASPTPTPTLLNQALANANNKLPGEPLGGICDDGPCLGESIFNNSGGHISLTPSASPIVTPVATANIWGTRTLQGVHGPPGGISQLATTGPDGKPTTLPVWFEAVTGVAVVVYLVVEGVGPDAVAAAAVVPPPPGLPG